MDVALVTVGDELLAGETVDSNAAWLGRELRDRGVRVPRVTTVPDDVDAIAEVVEEAHQRWDAVVVTGGLGPTHDDLTMTGVATALDRDVVENERAHEWLVEEGGYAAEDLAAGTADLPAGADPLDNEVGVAPGCVVENVYVLPGVPEEMRAMFADVADEFAGERTHVREVRAAEPESELLDRVDGVRETFDVSVGSYPGESVRLRVEAVEEEVADAAADWLRERVTEADEE
jgi:molybdenum cofactor synthesis domain-containing protein